MPALVNFSLYSALVVEDQPFVRSVITRILKQLEFGAIHEASDGAEALDLALERRPDVVICDIEMTPMDGLTFLQELRGRAAGGLVPPVAFLTNHASRGMVLKARDLGADAFIAKPVNVTGLKEKLQVLLGSRAKSLA